MFQKSKVVCSVGSADGCSKHNKIVKSWNCGLWNNPSVSLIAESSNTVHGGSTKGHLSVPSWNIMPRTARAWHLCSNVWSQYEFWVGLSAGRWFMGSRNHFCTFVLLSRHEQHAPWLWFASGLVSLLSFIVSLQWTQNVSTINAENLFLTELSGFLQIQQHRGTQLLILSHHTNLCGWKCFER